MKLVAIADLHVGHRQNREALERIRGDASAWLIVAGDVGEQPAHLTLALDLLTPRFARVIWTPGNHDLWCPPDATDRSRGQARYDELVGICRRFGVITPEDPFVEWPGEPGTYLAPLFLLYDYSFRPDDVAPDEVLDWAAAEGVVCADEALLHPTPYPDRRSWCAERVARTAERLAALPQECATVLVNHYPLQREHAVLPRIPRFAPWCGTRLTEDWHRRFRALAVVYGHLHVRRQFEQDDVAFHEVSLGYPRQWDERQPIDSYLRVIL
jgi:3',5'-cyclic AMP phosphodiesterase CpdA